MFFQNYKYAAVVDNTFAPFLGVVHIFWSFLLHIINAQLFHYSNKIIEFQDVQEEEVL
jgi:hypothetical protein